MDETEADPASVEVLRADSALRNEAAIDEIPQTHIVCSSTLPGRDVPTLEKRSDGRLWEIDTGHDLMITEPDAVARLLLRLAYL